MGSNDELAFAAAAALVEMADDDEEDDDDGTGEGALNRLRLTLAVVDSIDSEGKDNEDSDDEAFGAAAATAATGFGAAPINNSSAMRSLMDAMNATI